MDKHIKSQQWPVIVVSCVVQIEVSIQELAQEGMETRLAAAQVARDQKQTACEEAGAAVEAAERELAGAQAGDGRDESNRSLQERLADAQNAQARLLLKTVSSYCSRVVYHVAITQQVWRSQSQSRASSLANILQPTDVQLLLSD